MGATEDNERDPTGTSKALGKSFLRKGMFSSWDCLQSVSPDRGSKDRYIENQSVEDKWLTLGSVLEALAVSTPRLIGICCHHSYLLSSSLVPWWGGLFGAGL